VSDELIDYAAWGERFFATAVTAERVLGGVNVLAGRPIDMGPMGVGPGRIAKVTAKGRIGTATGERVGTDPVTFDVTLPVALEFVIEIGMEKLRFDADITVPLAITARGRDDLAIVIDVTPPQSADVVVRLKAQGLRASITSKAANVEGELKRFVAKYVARELEKPHIREATEIDVGAALAKAAAGIGPRAESPVADELTDDLPAAMEAELEQTAQLFIDDDAPDPGPSTDTGGAPR